MRTNSNTAFFSTSSRVLYSAKENLLCGFRLPQYCKQYFAMTKSNPPPDKDGSPLCTGRSPSLRLDCIDLCNHRLSFGSLPYLRPVVNLRREVIASCADLVVLPKDIIGFDNPSTTYGGPPSLTQGRLFKRTRFSRSLCSLC